MKKVLTVCFIVAWAFTMAACIKTAPEKAVSKTKKDITVVFVPKVTGNAFFESANAGAQEFAARNGFRVLYKGSPEALVDHQITIIKEAIEQKADAICVSALNTTALDGVMKQAITAGIKVTTWDSDISGDARLVMVSQGTPGQLGRMLVEMGAKSLTARGKNIEEHITYLWHYSQASVTDQNSWRNAGEEYIRATYPRWVNLAPENYYSEQNPARALATGKQILETFPDIDLIICNDSTSLPGQAQAAKELGRDSSNLTITGFASPNAMKDYCREGIVERWGLWDCKIQGALGCYLAYYLASGKTLKVGDRVSVPEIGTVEVMPNTVLDSSAYTAPNSGVVLLPSRVEFTSSNMDNYDF